jgi:hypothetical protein
MTSGVTGAVAKRRQSFTSEGLRFCSKNCRSSAISSLLDRIPRSHEVDFRREIGRPVDSLANERGDGVR